VPVNWTTYRDRHDGRVALLKSIRSATTSIPLPRLEARRLRRRDGSWCCTGPTNEEAESATLV